PRVGGAGFLGGRARHAERSLELRDIGRPAGAMACRGIARQNLEGGAQRPAAMRLAHSPRTLHGLSRTHRVLVASVAGRILKGNDLMRSFKALGVVRESVTHQMTAAQILITRCVPFRN